MSRSERVRHQRSTHEKLRRGEHPAPAESAGRAGVHVTAARPAKDLARPWSRRDESCRPSACKRTRVVHARRHPLQAHGGSAGSCELAPASVSLRGPFQAARATPSSAHRHRQRRPSGGRRRIAHLRPLTHWPWAHSSCDRPSFRRIISRCDALSHRQPVPRTCQRDASDRLEPGGSVEASGLLGQADVVDRLVRAQCVLRRRRLD